ncbi:MAG: HAD family hydrolase, partial [Promethearchaeota archaeon]
NKDLFQRLAIPLTQFTFSQICEIFYHTIREYPFIYPETQDVLSVLHQKYPRTIGLWSDTPFQSPGPIIHRFVEQFNIAKYFTHTFYSGDYGLRKPDPKTLELVQQKFNIEKSRMVYIGNSPKDIQTAVNFGIDGIWINRKLVKYPKEKGFPKPTFEISNLHEIIDILNE